MVNQERLGLMWKFKNARTGDVATENVFAFDMSVN